MVDPVQLVEALKGTGPIGVLGMIGIFSGTTWDSWREDFQLYSSLAGAFSLFLSVFWGFLIFIHRLFRLSFLRGLDWGVAAQN